MAFGSAFCFGVEASSICVGGASDVATDDRLAPAAVLKDMFFSWYSNIFIGIVGNLRT